MPGVYHSPNEGWREGRMRIFVTGATGHIGSRVVVELLEAGHQVVGLARSDKSVAALQAAGAAALRGDLDDLDSLRRGAAAADGVVHLAFKHDVAFTGGDFAGAASADLRAVQTIGDALAGSGKPFVFPAGAGPRVASENAAMEQAERGVRSSVVRLPPTVHSSFDKYGFVPTLIRLAREKGVSPYVGDGSNRWPAVHTLDAARLFRLALEAAPAGSRLHGVGDEGVPFRDIAEVIARHLNLPVVGISREEAGAHFGFLATIVSLDNPTSSAATQALLGWRPIHPGLIADLDEGHYFEVRSA